MAIFIVPAVRREIEGVEDERVSIEESNLGVECLEMAKCLFPCDFPTHIAKTLSNLRLKRFRLANDLLKPAVILPFLENLLLEFLQFHALLENWARRIPSRAQEHAEDLCLYCMSFALAPQHHNTSTVLYSETQF